jgi:hypothetical integral membrane protein (TIGR02206 family)
LDLLAGAHLAAVTVTAAVAVGAGWAARAAPGTWIVPFARGLALVIIGAYVVENIAVVTRGSWSAERSLPLHLTDAVTLVAALALWRPRPLAVELAYFWGLTASLQAVLTPDLDSGTPSLYVWTYFVTHSGAVIAAVFLTFGLGLAPRPGAVPRVLVATAAFTALAAVGDVLTGGNYMFLREKPDRASLLDLMGPWPWYIGTGALLAAAMFTVLDLPFRARRARFDPRRDA